MDFRIDLNRPNVIEVPLKDVKPFFRVCPLCYVEDSMNVETEEH